MQRIADLLREMFAYNRAVNQKVILFFQQHAFTDEKALRLFCHILDAHHIWLSRIREQASLYDVWQLHAVADFEDIDEDNHQATTAVLSSSPDFDRLIAYRNSSGKQYQNRLYDMLLHVVNHGTYHRGQIASIIREKGYDPPVTDYIFYQREQ